MVTAEGLPSGTKGFSHLQFESPSYLPVIWYVLQCCECQTLSSDCKNNLMLRISRSPTTTSIFCWDLMSLTIKFESNMDLDPLYGTTS
ncbi:hypothetical protein NQZ68_032420 [Dissostichus eleginoides]|nr:hypothetical protein NQZ68_032420 [Dissostichus eleginoides]